LIKQTSFSDVKQMNSSSDGAIDLQTFDYKNRFYHFKNSTEKGVFEEKNET
jgi:hypothetical protein